MVTIKQIEEIADRVAITWDGETWGISLEHEDIGDQVMFIPISVLIGDAVEEYGFDHIQSLAVSILMTLRMFAPNDGEKKVH